MKNAYFLLIFIYLFILIIRTGCIKLKKNKYKTGISQLSVRLGENKEKYVIMMLADPSKMNNFQNIMMLTSLRFLSSLKKVLFIPFLLSASFILMISM